MQYDLRLIACKVPCEGGSGCGTNECTSVPRSRVTLRTGLAQHNIVLQGRDLYRFDFCSVIQYSSYGYCSQQLCVNCHRVGSHMISLTEVPPKSD
jgi:hypothetical protein